MVTPVTMPKLGMEMQEGTVVEWLKRQGDLVQQGEPLVEITTDKITYQIEARLQGT